MYTPNRAVDQARYEPIPINSIQVGPGDPLLRYVTTRLEAGKGLIGIGSEPGEHELEQPVSPNLVAPAAGIATAKLTIANAGNVLTLSGTIQVGDVVGVTLGPLGATYQVLSTDTLASIATGLAANCNTAGIAATHAGVTVTVTVTGNALAAFAVGTELSYGNATWRRRKVFNATLWFPTPFDLSGVGKVVESLFFPGQRLPLGDGPSADILSMSSFDHIDQQRDGAFLRRVRWHIYFVTILPLTATQVVAAGQALTSTGQPIASVIPTQYTNAPNAAQL